MMGERGLANVHSTLPARCSVRSRADERIRSQIRNPNPSWRVDETYPELPVRQRFFIVPSTPLKTPLITCGVAGSAQIKANPMVPPPQSLSKRTCDTTIRRTDIAV
jgi:hypothetical protein